MAFRVFSPRPQRSLACGRRSRSFGLGEKTSERWERQPRKPFVGKYRPIRSTFLRGKSNACADNFGRVLRQHVGVSVDSSGGARPMQRTKPFATFLSTGRGRGQRQRWIEAGNFAKLEIAEL